MEDAPNPVVETSTFLDADGISWICRKRKDGSWDAVVSGSPVISPGFTSYQELAEWLRHEDSVKALWEGGVI